MKIPMPNKLLDLSGKVALITGASSGLGAGIAKRFAQAGADIAICDLLPSNDVMNEINNLGVNCVSAITDVTDPKQVSNLFDKIENELSSVDILINNAGIYPNAKILDMSVNDWDRMIEVNLRSIFITTKTAAERMIKSSKKGAIINISSIESMVPSIGHAHYSASKAGAVMFGKTAALELSQYGIRVNSVSPSLFNRPNLENEWPGGVDRFLKRAPLKRIGEVEDIADACLFLSSEASRWITGVNLAVDGGVLVNEAY